MSKKILKRFIRFFRAKDTLVINELFDNHFVTRHSRYKEKISKKFTDKQAIKFAKNKREKDYTYVSITHIYRNGKEIYNGWKFHGWIRS